MPDTLLYDDKYYFFYLMEDWDKPPKLWHYLILHSLKSLENWIKVQSIHVAQPELKPSLQISKCVLITRTMPLRHGYLCEQS